LSETDSPHGVNFEAESQSLNLSKKNQCEDDYKKKMVCGTWKQNSVGTLGIEMKAAKKKRENKLTEGNNSQKLKGTRETFT